MIRKKTFLPTVLAGVLLFTAVSCDKDDNDKPLSNKYNVTGGASGSQEVPVVASNGTATIVSTYDADANTLAYTITWADLNDNVNNMHSLWNHISMHRDLYQTNYNDKAAFLFLHSTNDNNLCKDYLSNSYFV